MNVELIGRLYAFAVILADHYDAPPSHLKTAQHYQMAERARQLRAEVLTEGFTGLTTTDDVTNTQRGGVADASATSKLTTRIAGCGHQITTQAQPIVTLQTSLPAVTNHPDHQPVAVLPGVV